MDLFSCAKIDFLQFNDKLTQFKEMQPAKKEWKTKIDTVWSFLTASLVKVNNMQHEIDIFSGARIDFMWFNGKLTSLEKSIGQVRMKN